jgi:hypothetical protein
MSFMQKLVSALVTASLLIGATGARALADTGTPQQVMVRCDQGACTVAVGLDGVSPLVKAGAALGVAALKTKAGQLPAGTRLEVDQNLTLTLPMGEIVLPKAQLTVETGDNNRIERLRGTAQVALPTLGALSDVHTRQPARAEVGLDTGKNLGYLDAPLHPERCYLFLDISSGFDVAGKVAGTGAALDLSAPAGQHVTLVIDTEQPLVYLAGMLSVSHSGQMALIGPLRKLAQESEVIPDALPVQQDSRWTVSALAGKGVDRSLQLGGAWGVEANALKSWLGIEASPLAVEGLLTLTPDGMLLDGVARSSLEPATIFDGAAELKAYIPFRGDLGDAFVEARGTVSVPLADVHADASARINWPLDVDAAAHVVTPQSTTGANGDVAASEPGAPTRARQLLASAGDWAARGVAAAGATLDRGGDWIARNVTAGRAAITQALPASSSDR